MKAHEAVIAWTPADWSGRDTQGKVEVGRLISDTEGDWTAPYAYVGGAAYLAIRDSRGPEGVAQLFIDFHTLVVRDGLSPQAVHDAFLAIDEYVDSISIDIPGARERDTEYSEWRRFLYGR